VFLCSRRALLLGVILWLQRRNLLLRLRDRRLCPQRLLACFCRHQRRQILRSLSVSCPSVVLSNDVLMPAFSELPMIRVVQPAYHCFPNGGHGSFFPSANLRLSCDRVFATMGRSGMFVGLWKYSRLRTFGGVCYGYTQSVKVFKLQMSILLHISTAPAVAPAIMERIALGYDI
jgi:hypothetical protein